MPRPLELQRDAAAATQPQALLREGRTALRDGSGGGGYGPPAERDPALRARDRLEGYVTG